MVMESLPVVRKYVCTANVKFYLPVVPHVPRIVDISRAFEVFQGKVFQRVEGKLNVESIYGVRVLYFDDDAGLLIFRVFCDPKICLDTLCAHVALLLKADVEDLKILISATVMPKIKKKLIEEGEISGLVLQENGEDEEKKKKKEVGEKSDVDTAETKSSAETNAKGVTENNDSGKSSDQDSSKGENNKYNASEPNKKRKLKASENGGAQHKAGGAEGLEIEGSENEKGSKKAKHSSTQENVEPDLTKKKIKWKKLITSALKSNEDGSMKLKKLTKFVLKSLKESGFTEDEKQVLGTLEQKINSSSKFTVDGKYVRIAETNAKGVTENNDSGESSDQDSSKGENNNYNASEPNKKRKLKASENGGAQHKAGGAEGLEIEGSENEKGSKKAKHSSTQEYVEPDLTKKKIKWKKLITSALRSNEDGSMKLKKLTKFVLKSLKESGFTEDEKQALGTLEQKINSSSKFTVDGKYVRIAATNLRIVPIPPDCDS